MTDLIECAQKDANRTIMLNPTTGRLVSLSAKQVQDCCRECQYGRGGFPGVWNYIKKTGGIEKQADYPFSRDNKCRFDPM